MSAISEYLAIIETFVMKIRYKNIMLYCPKTGLKGFIDIRKAAAITGRSVRTAQRWARTGNIEPPSLRLLEFHIFGWIPLPEWDGWRISRDTLYQHSAHHSYWWDRARLQDWWLLRQVADNYRRELQSLTGRQLTWLPNGTHEHQELLARQNMAIEMRLQDRLAVDAEFYRVDFLQSDPTHIAYKKARI